jgi:hypothetical protein
MIRKLTRTEYAARKLPHARKARIRKKWARRIQVPFREYCYRHYGRSLETTFHIYIGTELKEAIERDFRPNEPSLWQLVKDEAFVGGEVSLPVHFGPLESKHE